MVEKRKLKCLREVIMNEAKIIYIGIVMLIIIVSVWVFLDIQQINWKGLTNKEIIEQVAECEQAKMCVYLRKNAYGEVKAVICDVCKKIKRLNNEVLKKIIIR